MIRDSFRCTPAADDVDEHELAEPCGDKKSGDVHTEQKKRQANWLRQGNASGGNERRPKKRRRVASFCWMNALDNQFLWQPARG